MEESKKLDPTQSAITEYTVEVRLRSGAPETTRGNVRVEIFSPHQRMRRALNGLGLSWGAALVCVFLPFAHFFLVPLALFAGPFVAIFLYRIPSVILPTTVPCPKCQAPVFIERAPERWPIPELCTKCTSEVHVCRLPVEAIG